MLQVDNKRPTEEEGLDTLKSQISVLSNIESKHKEVKAEKCPSEDGLSDSLKLYEKRVDKVLIV